MDANKTAGEKTGWQLHKNAACNPEQVYTVKWFQLLLSSSYNNQLIGLVGRVFANSPGDLGSIPGCVILKTFKMVLDTSLLNTQQYKVRIKGKVEQFREKSSAFPYTSV